MARGSTVAGHRHAHTNGHKSGASLHPQQEVPPTSTLATQIVNNLASTTNGLPKPEDRGHFEQLLLEILQTGRGSSAPDESAIDTDLEVNNKLITVVTTAGLEVLQHDDPFARSEQRLSQAQNSLRVIQLTIQRTPLVLFITSSEPGHGHGLQPARPLYVWLLPKLIGILGLNHLNESIQGTLVALLESILAEPSRASRDGVKAEQLKQYYRICVTGMDSSTGALMNIERLTHIISSSSGQHRRQSNSAEEYSR